MAFPSKGKISDELKASAGESAAGLMRGILFGEKTEIGEDTLEEFQRNGTAHILAVSGLHIGILYGVLGKVWRGKKGWLYFWMVTLVLLGYSFLASFSPSVIRASVMIVLHLYAKVRHLRYDLGSASFVVLLADPSAKSHAAVPHWSADVFSGSADIIFCGAVFSQVLPGDLPVQRCGAAGTVALHGICVQLHVAGIGLYQRSHHIVGGVSRSAGDRRIRNGSAVVTDGFAVRCGFYVRRCFSNAFELAGAGAEWALPAIDDVQRYDLYQGRDFF